MLTRDEDKCFDQKQRLTQILSLVVFKVLLLCFYKFKKYTYVKGLGLFTHFLIIVEFFGFGGSCDEIKDNNRLNEKYIHIVALIVNHCVMMPMFPRLEIPGVIINYLCFIAKVVIDNYKKTNGLLVIIGHGLQLLLFPLLVYFNKREQNFILKYHLE